MKKKELIKLVESVILGDSLNKNIKIYKTITSDEWEKTHSDYKKIIDGVKYKMFLDPDKGTILAPVEVSDSISEKKSDDPCWKGYEQIGMKTKNGKEVPNCVKIKK